MAAEEVVDVVAFNDDEEEEEYEERDAEEEEEERLVKERAEGVVMGAEKEKVRASSFDFM